MASKQRSLRVIFLSAILLTVSTETLAENNVELPPPSTSVIARFDEGRQAYEQANYPRAVELFRAVLAESFSPNARLYLARSLRQSGDLSQAFNEYMDAALEAERAAVNAERYQATRRAALEESRPLLTRVGLIDARIGPASANVTLNGVLVTSARRAHPIAHAPGAVVLEASAPEMASQRVELNVQAGQLTRVTVTLVSGSVNGSVQMSMPSTPNVSSAPTQYQASDWGIRGTTPLAPPPARTASGLVPAGIVVGLVGVSAAVAGGVLGALNGDAHARLVADCASSQAPDPCDSDTQIQTRVQAGRAMQTATIVTLAAGGALALVGTVLTLAGIAQNEPVRTSAGLANRAVVRWQPIAWATPSQALLGVQGSF
ncbi:MAG: hypothetical protein Q8Q09_13630 [Deltaproteobacteria bacterium]|nr:hypothetical protein [Deltaproteobacteria bacterium]